MSDIGVNRGYAAPGHTEPQFVALDFAGFVMAFLMTLGPLAATAYFVH